MGFCVKKDGFSVKRDRFTCFGHIKIADFGFMVNLKLGNVLVFRNGDVKITDFGFFIVI